MQFRLLAADSQNTLLEFTFNQDYGIIIKTPSSTSSSKENFLDLNIFNSQKQTDLFLTLYENKVYLSVQGLTFNDIIYCSEEILADGAQYLLKFDDQYHLGISKFAIDSFHLNG